MAIWYNLMKMAFSANSVAITTIFAVQDALLFKSAKRYDVKGRKYFDSIQKYYAVDLGLRNARLNFRHLNALSRLYYN